MNKKTKMYVGVALVAVAAYYFWNKKKKESAAVAAPAAKASMVGKEVGVVGARTKAFASTTSTGHSK